MKKALSLTVRPLNPDNEVEIQHLVALFERCGDSGILSSAVFSPRFWKNSAGRRFSSIIALAEGKVVAHCGFGIQKSSPSMATLTHIMVDSDYAEVTPDLVEGFEEIIAGQMQRKGLSAISALRHGSGSTAVEEFMRGLRMVPVAELPDEARGIEIWARVFDRSNRSLQFVPTSLRATVTAAFRSLGIGAVASITPKDEPAAMSADDVAIEPFPACRSGRAFLFVTPSLLRRTSREGWIPEPLEKALSRWPHAYVAVKIADPECTEMIQLLQSRGFSYLGILPAFGGWDTILLSRIPAESEQLEAPMQLSARESRS